ncbi:fatty acid desaturase [Paenibacillus montanisoli]|uniref:Fatty acid desaturase n=1 Tax=Paenibacillus montanisoli TaxID=2081970 RepID=A0A328TXK9_9BACL|nr:fatty acid desaturase [Paenibacillus montanisoli]RAP73841.1 fatty acid desaturase [Paenibacillus montanisoli]
MNAAAKRDYSILGPEREKAIENGLVSADWYTCPIPRKRLKELVARRNAPAARDILFWLIALGFTGYIAYLSWGSWWAIPAFALYGTVYSVSSVSKWHEYGHGTPFKTAWMNEAIYQITSFLILIQATNFRWSHVRHHTDTIIVGSDPEIMEPRPPMWKRLFKSLLRVDDLRGNTAKSLFMHAFGRLNAQEKELIPSSQYRALFWEARIFLLLYAAIIALCFYVHSILPLMFIGLPAYYGFFLMTCLNATQHLGLFEDKLDHRLCCRTFYTNPILRFLYTNMNYHAEHHMFPMVPFYNLPALHEEIKRDCPAAAPSFPAALRETVAALWTIRKDPTFVVPRYREFANRIEQDAKGA